MAKKKKSKASENESFQYSVELTGLILILIGLIGFGFGPVGSYIKKFAMFLVGGWAWIFLLIFLLFLGSYMLFKRKLPRFLSQRLIGLYVIIIVILVASHFGFIENCKGAGDIFQTTISKFMDRISTIGNNTALFTSGDISIEIGGGMIGMLVALPAAKLLGETGAVILAVGVAVLLLIFMFGIHPADMITNAVENMEEKREQRRERRLEEEEEEDEEEEEEIVVRPQRKEKVRKTKPSSIDIPLDDDQITINLNDEPKGLQKYDHSEDDLTPLTMKSPKPKKGKSIDIDIGEEEPPKQEKEESSPNELENIFKTEQPVKEEQTKEVLVLEHTMTTEDDNYEFPPIELLSEGKVTQKGGKKAIADNATRLQKTLYSFGVSAKVENVSVGPSITRYELKPAEGVRVNKIANLADDIALNLAAESIRIEAPIPGKQAVGIEVPNKETEMVHLRDILESSDFVNFSSNLAFALGKDVAGNGVVTDIGKMPHVLIAGSTGSR